MSELAFNANGECFEVPAAVTAWRVRRMKPRGAPELVYGRDGRPLMISIDSDMHDLREAVSGVLGRYRLDPINEDGKVVESVSPAYIQVVKPEPIGDDEEAVVAPRDAADDAIREAMRLNTELARAVIDRFPQMVEAAATLIRAADGAGLPARPPMANDSDEYVDDVGEDEPTAPNGLDLNALLAQLVPMIVGSIANGKGKLPDLASVLDWRKAKPQKRAEKPEAPKEEAAGLPPLDPSMMAHFLAVQSALTADEARLAREVAAELDPKQLRVWFDELSKLSVPEAVARVRALLAKGGVS